MTYHKILLSGDYWHNDFQGLVSSIDTVLTMTPIEKMSRFKENDDQFDLILIAQTRRDQIDPAVVEFLKTRFAGTPVVFVLGSWCEGESRSGEPISGVLRIYWHQWMGRYDKFVNQLAANKITDWHFPPTATVADRAEKFVPRPNHLKADIIGVSAWTEGQYDMLADGLKTLGFKSRWLERSTWDAEAIALLSAICVDANSVSDDLVNRLQWLQATFPGRPLVLILNFPRANEIKSAHELGVAEVISKPFELSDLQAAVTRVAEKPVKNDRTIIS